MENITCNYCGKIKEELTFVIGASIEPEWCMHEGTGKMSCPDCFLKAKREGQERIKQFCGSI